jgi:HNH endonuclease
VNPGPKPKSLRERLYGRCNLSPNGCLLWSGAIAKETGYGNIRIKDEGGWRTELTHRLSYMISVGPVPDGMMVCHHCDTRACILPGCLFLGTNTDNMRDCASKGRTARLVGTLCGKARLTEVAAQTIFARRSAGARCIDLAGEFNIDASVVSRIGSGGAWPHISGGPAT